MTFAQHVKYSRLSYVWTSKQRNAELAAAMSAPHQHAWRNVATMNGVTTKNIPMEITPSAASRRDAQRQRAPRESTHASLHFFCICLCYERA